MEGWPEIGAPILSTNIFFSARWRNWAQIPPNALSLIFQKLGAVHVMLSLKAVCRSWRQLALKCDESLWRCIDLRCLPLYTFFRIQEENLAMAAVHRSSLVEELHLMSASDDLLNNIAHRITSLRCFSLMCCLDVSSEVLVNFLSRCPLLEELCLYQCFFWHDTFRDIGKTCPELKRLWVAAEPDSISSPYDSENEYRLLKKSDKWEGEICFETMSSFCDSDLEASPCLHPDSDSDFNCDDIQYMSTSEEDNCLSEEEGEDPPAKHLSKEERRPSRLSKEERRANHISKEDKRAMEIACNMPQLRELHLVRSFRLTNKGLNAILDKCLVLEALELLCCFNLRIDGTLNAKLNGIKSVNVSRRSYI